MMRFFAATGLAFTLAACASTEPSVPPPPPPPLGPPMAGATLLGHGAYRTAAGARGSCAGYSVALMADTPQTRERMLTLYGSTLHAIAPISLVKSRSTKLAGGDENQLIGSAQCDPAGDFVFNGLAAGSYFVIARVLVAPPVDGERDFVIMRRINLRPAETRDVTLAP
jgi:hypothetical protein